MKIQLYNKFHLGDHVYQMRYNTKLMDIYDNILIDYYLPKEYMSDIIKLLDNKYIGKIHFFDINETPPTAIDTWIGSDNFYYEFIKQNKSYNEMYISFFYFLSKKLGLLNPVSSNNDLLFDDNALLINNELSNMCDILLINSRPNSGQYDYNEQDFNNFILKYKNKYRIVTTDYNRMSDVPCTRDYNLSLHGIGNISINSKFIIGIHTSPYIYTFNKYNNNKNIQWVILQKYGITHTFNKNIHNIDSITKININ